MCYSKPRHGSTRAEGPPTRGAPGEGRQGTQGATSGRSCAATENRCEAPRKGPVLFALNLKICAALAKVQSAQPPMTSAGRNHKLRHSRFQAALRRTASKDMSRARGRAHRHRHQSPWGLISRSTGPMPCLVSQHLVPSGAKGYERSVEKYTPGCGTL